VVGGAVPVEIGDLLSVRQLSHEGEEGHMRRYNLTETILVAATVVMFSAGYTYAQDFSARLNGFEELGAQNNETGAILSDGKGTLKLTLDQNAGTLSYTLIYSNVGTTAPGTGTVTQAHIHFGKEHVAGGIIAFLCTNLGNGPAGTPACPANSGTVTGTITAASVVAITKQNVSAGDFDALEDALTSNTAYANIHTTAFLAGEIRGQIDGQDDQGQNNDNQGENEQ
jgi:CHRD domain-containing protein